jgi:hypothetical protein
VNSIFISIKNKIKEKRNSNNPFWKTLFVCRDIVRNKLDRRCHVGPLPMPIFPNSADKIMLPIIPPHYWKGSLCLEYGNPWLTPGAIFFLANYLRPEFKVLELGSGGSTIFFAKRCKTVISIETNKAWHDRVKKRLSEANIGNVEFINKFNSCEGDKYKQFLNKLPDDHFDCILIDAESSIDRGVCANSLKSKLKIGGFIVYDNYCRKHTRAEFDSWTSFYYDDPHWDGKGTSIHIKC